MVREYKSENVPWVEHTSSGTDTCISKPQLIVLQYSKVR